MQRIRRNDYWDTFSLYLENTEDPAIKDENLAKKLAENRTEGDKRITAVFEKYAKKQEEIKDQNEEIASLEDEEEEEEDSIIDENKNNENLSISEKDSDNEEDIDETIKENSLFMETNKSNVNVINITTNKVILNKTIVDTLQEKCDKIKVWKKSDTAVLKDENKTISENIIQEPCSSDANSKNVVENVMDAKMQEDSTVPDSTINCTSSIYINRIEDI